MHTSPFLDLFIHSAGVVFADIVGNHQHFHSNGPLAHGDLQLVAYFYIVAGFDYPAIDADAAVIAGFVGYGPALDQPGYLQIFVQSHRLIWIQCPSEPYWP